MDNEEIQSLIQEMTDGLDELSNLERKLNKEERKRKHLLQMKQDILMRIKKARDDNNSSQEYNLLVNYGIVTSLGEKHPILMMLVKSTLSIIG